MRTRYPLLLALLSGFIVTLPVFAGTPEPVPHEGQKPLMAADNSGNKLSMMPGFCNIQTLMTDPVSGDSLTHRYIDILIVNEDVDPPGELKNDRIQTVLPHYNEERLRKHCYQNPGHVDALFTVFIEEINPEDERVQLWETIVMRVYNAEDKQQATHFRDSEPWKTQPGFIKLSPGELAFSEWVELEHQ